MTDHEATAYEPHQMRLLERLANQIGNEGMLFHEIASAFKDANAERAAAFVKGLRRAADICSTKSHAIECLLGIRAEIDEASNP